MKRVGAFIVIWILSAIASADASDNMKAFPLAKEGMVRYVLPLSPQADESAFRVELIIGKTMLVDRQNRYFFSGQIEAETIKGWGFTRYIMNKLGPMAGTLMSVDPEAPKDERFVTLGGEPFFVRYNSRLPVVVYLPEGVEVRYRIWTAGDEVKTVVKN